MQEIRANFRTFVTRLLNRPALLVEAHEELLLNDAFAPITSEIGYLKADLQTVVEHYLRWQRAIPQNVHSRWSQRTITSDLKENLRALLPLTSFPLRHLFVPTQNHGSATQ